MTDEPRAEQRPRRPRQRHERVGRHVQREREPVARGVDEAALQVLPLGEGEGVDEDVERVVRLAPAREDPLDLLVGLDVARLDEGRPDRLGQRPDALLDQALDRREADLGALGVERLGDPPGDRVVVGDAEDERRLAVEQSHPVLRAVLSPGSLPSAAWHRIDCAPRSGACAGWSSMPTASSSSRASRCRARSTRSGASRIAGSRSGSSPTSRRCIARRWPRWMGKSGLAIDPAPDHHAGPRPRPPTPRRSIPAGRCWCSPPRTRAASSTASGS